MEVTDLFGTKLVRDYVLKDSLGTKWDFNEVPCLVGYIGLRISKKVL